MFEYIKGRLASATPIKAVIDVNGVGYGIFIPLNGFAKLPAVGQETLLHVIPIIREDAHQLYGFSTEVEKELFHKFTQISGIGPKTALALVGHLEQGQLLQAISQGNALLLSKVPGIGKKTAERLIIEMRDKLKPFEGRVASTAVHSTLMNDALSALIHLGYNQAHVQKALQEILENSKKEPNLSELITAALRIL